MLMCVLMEAPKPLTPPRGSLYKETVALRHLTTQTHNPIADDDEDDEPVVDVAKYLKIVAALSAISLMLGFLLAALLQ
jgi:hypothetical protein